VTMLGRILAVATLIPLAFAFSDTLPIIAWSSHRSSTLDLLSSTPSTPSHSGAVFENILLNDDICEYDAIILVDQPGLHASDLRTVSPSSALTTLLMSSPSSVQLPYVRRSVDVSVHDIANTISSRCGSRVLSFMPGQGGVSVEQGSKHVMCLSMPHLEGAAGRRKSVMADYESRLAHELGSLASTFPKHLVVYAGSTSPQFERRQAELDSLDAPAPLLGALQPGNSTLPEGGILKRYQLLTPALITSLLIAFFLILPVVFFGVYALASIQSPLRTEAPKGFNAQEKKTQ